MAKQKNSGNLSSFYKGHPIICHLFLIIIASLLVGWLSLCFLGIWTNHGATALVPDVKDMTYNQAYNKLSKNGFKVEIADSVFDDRILPGTVIESWPRAGAVVKPGREIYLTVTSFEPRKVQITMPLKDVSSRQALSYLESVGIKNVRIQSVPSQFADLVLGAQYQGKDIVPGMQIPVNALITLEVGSVPIAEINEPNDSIDTDMALDGDNDNSDQPSSSYYD